MWSTSWVFIKDGLEDIPPLTFAALRYVLAFLVLLPFWYFSAARRQEGKIGKKALGKLGVYGLLFYTLNQGAMFLGLVVMEAVTFSVVLNLTVVAVAILGIFFLKEIPQKHQWMGLLVFFAGLLVYFLPQEPSFALSLGLLFGLAVVLANAGATLYGRSINRQNDLSPLSVTVISMGIGSLLLLAVALIVEGVPVIPMQVWPNILILSLLNTALAFTLWNKAMQTLGAMEISMINNTMLVQIALLAWIFLNEQITLVEIGGMALVLLGAGLVQIKRGAKAEA